VAISTLDGLIAGMKPPHHFTKAAFTGEAAGQNHNLAALIGQPAAQALGTPGLAGATVSAGDAIGGMFPWADPSSGNAYLAQFVASVGAAIVGIFLYDLLWYNSGLVVTTTTAQTINSVAWPARSKDGTANGDGIEIWMHCTVATTNAGAIANTSYSYTNQAGTAGRSANLAYSWPATAVAGTFVPFAFQGNDTGVRSVQSITLGTSYAAGTLKVLALRRIAFLPMVGAVSGDFRDAIALGMPQLFNGSALYLGALLSSTAAGTVSGSIAYSHG